MNFKSTLLENNIIIDFILKSKIRYNDEIPIEIIIYML
jgi:hypothetical protein